MDLDKLLTVTRQVCGIDETEELKAMLNFYHDLGVIVKHGHTVVLQAQWLIDLFKQLIAVRPFDEVNPLYSECWQELEESGILRMTLVDHVFTDFIQKDLSKEDILDMMELYGLIAKFSFLPAVDEHEQRYFVPAQLRSSPSNLCKKEPSNCDPCPLYLRFLDGFVPHGLFPQLLSRCIRWCSDHSPKEAPKLYQNGATFLIGKQTISELTLICKKRFIKIILKQINSLASTITTSAKLAPEVRVFIEDTLQGLSNAFSWLRNLRYELCVACTNCLECGEECTPDDCLHLVRVVPEETLICSEGSCNVIIEVCGLEKWFQGHKTETTVWENFTAIEKDFIEPLRQALKVTRIQYQAELTSKRDEMAGNKSNKKKQSMEFDVQSPDGETLELMPLSDQCEALQSGLYSLDMMESVLARITEIASSRTKGGK
ncbi:hypothetical protein OS493_005802 [Desmophyllum pertusum]|uniref:Uncharacterized protein n=1 Tax=Desmophyllum pertusum TaxID=174260 RepID=A0A9W9YFE4_9CNID|nr:hypothetical protein OS493_005802 [Desmophyllum pertusum]